MQKIFFVLFLLSGFLLWLGYALLIGFYRRGWRGLSATAMPPTAERPFLSVLVPARNEAANLPQLFAALCAQSYPSHFFEVLLLDDHSADATGDIARAAGGNVRCVALPEDVQGKKGAIAYGVQQARGPWIVCTDADCVPPPGWLQALSGLMPDAAFVAAPVRYRNPNGMCAVFQTLDFLTLQGITAASVRSGFHSMCNGANLAYKKEAFEQVGGFAGVDHLASGDDLLLMHKIAKQYPGQVRYCLSPEAIVDTDPAPGWIAFWKQRIRWASKSAHYDDKRIFWALLLLFAFNVWFVAGFICSFYNPYGFIALLVIMLMKTIVEIRFLIPVARFYGQKGLLRYFPFLQPLHILYTVLVGLLSQFGAYEWKGRRLR